MTARIIIHSHRGRTLKRLLDERQDFAPGFIEDLAANPPEVREIFYEQVIPHTRLRIKKRVAAEERRRNG
jgi:hypothetical protein